MNWGYKLILVLSILLLSSINLYGSEVGGSHHLPNLPLYSVVPFILMLLSIAILPLVVRHWWENNRNKFIISLILGLPVGIYFFITSPYELIKTVVEYSSFIILLASLYIISGGILLKGNIEATPLVNTTFLFIGSILASFMGTTGASMLLIRPLLSTNRERKYVAHTVIFFIFLVANIGGCLTPLGDPPLYMGYLFGVPFSWTFSLLIEWGFMVLLLLVIYFIWDTIVYKKEKPSDILKDKIERQPLRLLGVINFPLLAGIVISIALGDKLPIFIKSGPKPTDPSLGLREILMILLAITSWITTKKEVRKENEFSFGPIIEVAVLFFGIFLTMIPAIVLLETRGGELGVTKPWQFFWATGSLSSFLDNTPTYVVFFSLAKGATENNIFPPDIIGHVVAQTGVPDVILRAISLGAVFMGANTYIGNGPNFMVKAIAEERGIEMPSFFGYMVYSVVILIPLFVLVTFIFIS